jgi:glycosyltransferase involved in cell wall biosynthesis
MKTIKDGRERRIFKDGPHHDAAQAIKLFPDGKIHSAYLDMVTHPPEGVNYMGDFSHARPFVVDGGSWFRRAADYLMMPYVFTVESPYLIHSCQKLLNTKSDFVVDIEHGNPFMGPYNVFKHEYQPFQAIVKKILSADNCKAIMPWSKAAQAAFIWNFDFLGDKTLFDKLKVIYPATPSIGIGRKFDKFTFIFVGGESFYAKGGLQTLLAFLFLKKQHNMDADLIMIGNIPQKIKELFTIPQMHELGLWMIGPVRRQVLLDTMSLSHCLVLPTHGDTFGMTVLEAKARGLPSIMVDSFSANELITHNKTGLIIEPDEAVNKWFDEMGCKRMGKNEFHSQFNDYNPSNLHVMRLALAMSKMLKDKCGNMPQHCIKESRHGKFSVRERNKKLKEVYER